jgi:hypothetical protein
MPGEVDIVNVLPPGKAMCESARSHGVNVGIIVDVNAEYIPGVIVIRADDVFGE